MAFNHEQLDVYKLALEYVRWVYSVEKKLSTLHRHAKDQLVRASQSIPLNIAEGNAKATDGDRHKFFEIARGSAFECASIQDVLEVRGAINSQTNCAGKEYLDRISAMLTRMCGRSYSIRELSTPYLA
jgi:four helix bundle protein